MNAPRTKGGRFAPGTSPNPKGKPRGAHKATGLRKELSDCLPTVLATVARLAVMGDLVACRLVLERCVPAMRPADAAVTINLCGTLSEQGQAVIAAIGTGQVTPAQGAQIVAALAAQAKIVDGTELADRIARLEGLHDDSTR